LHLHNDEIKSVEPRDPGHGMMRGVPEFRFKMHDGRVHVLRRRLTSDQMERAELLLERYLPGKLITRSSSSDSASGVHSKLDYVVLSGVLTAFLLFTLEYFFLAEEYYAGGKPWALIVCITVISTALVVGAAGKSASKREDLKKVAVASLMGLGLLTYAILPRMNQWTDRDGLQPIEYTLGEDRVWRADDAELPTFEFGGQGSFWDAIPTGTQKRFDLRKGGLGFWQINMARLYEQQKAYYER
jgi:hypothetical protein